MSDDENHKRSIEIYDAYRDELLKRQLSNTENYDKTILTLSSSGLAISLTFLKYVVPFETAKCLILIQASWAFFLLTITISLIAYLVGNAAIDRQMEIAEKYYVQKDSSAFNETNKLSIINDWLNKFMGLFFIIAITMIVIFVIINLNIKDTDMSNKKPQNKISRSVIANDSAAIPQMQKVPNKPILTNSAKIPTMQAAPGHTTTQQSTSTQQQQAGAKSQKTNSR